jgi:hypothetical protein
VQLGEAIEAKREGPAEALAIAAELVEDNALGNDVAGDRDAAQCMLCEPDGDASARRVDGAVRRVGTFSVHDDEGTALTRMKLAKPDE